MLLSLTLLSNGMIDWAIEICEMNSSNSYVYDTSIEENTCCCENPATSDCCKTTYFYYFTPKFIENNKSINFNNPEFAFDCNYFNLQLNENFEKITSSRNGQSRPPDRWRLRSFVQPEVKCVWII